MSSKEFLDYEVALLLAKYGSSAVLGALSNKLQLRPDELASMLRALPKKRPRNVKRKVMPYEIVAQIAQKHPQKAELLKVLGRRFENKMFLPELRDVRQFFRSHAHDPGALRSRADSTAKLVGLLADLDKSELESLCQSPEGTYSSLGLISDEILRRH